MDDSENTSLRKAFASSPGHEAIRDFLFGRVATILADLLPRNLRDEAILGLVADYRAAYDLLTSIDQSVQEVQVFASEAIRKMQEKESAEMAQFDQAFEAARRARGSEPLR